MTSWIHAHRLRFAGLVALVALGLVAFLTTQPSGSSGSSPSPASTSTSTPVAAAGTSTTVDPASATTTAPDPELATGLPGPAVDLPLEVTMASSGPDPQGVQTLTVHVEAESGSQIFGAEARVCPSDVVVTQDADLRPTLTGRCVLHPLPAGADDRVEVAGVAPYQALDLVFRTGPGEDTYTTQAGESVTVRCDSQHQCSLVLKLQIPNAYGFQAIPIPYS